MDIYAAIAHENEADRWQDVPASGGGVQAYICHHLDGRYHWVGLALVI